MNSLTLAPGERAEIIVDFSTYKKGDHISLLNDNFTLVDFNVKIRL
jgi:FtsP/CotA-like multicopper oxidase with cupredoxin domain